jgi:membrane-bound ClpP family serine protease
LEILALIGLVGSIISLAQMEANWLAVLAIAVGVSAFIIMPFAKEQYTPLAVGGLILQGLGAVFLFNDGTAVSVFIIGVTLAISLAYHQLVLFPMFKKVREQPIEHRDDQLIGARGRVIKELNPMGSVRVNSEPWTAISDKPLKVGDEVIVVERSGLQLVVEGIKHKRAEQDTEEENE